MADTGREDADGAVVHAGGRGAESELTPERTRDAAWAEHDRMHYYWMMADLDRRLPKRSYESMLPEDRVLVAQ